MYLIGPNRMAVQIPYTFDRKDLPPNLHLIALHNLLNRLSNITQPNINPCLTNPRISSLLHRLQQRIIHRIKTNRPRRVNNPPINLTPKIHLHHIIILQHGVIPGIRRIMRRHVVDTTPSRKPNTTFEPVLTNELPVLVLESFAHISELNTGFNEGLCIGSDLTVYFGRMTEFGVNIRLHSVTGTFFGGSCAVGDTLALGIGGLFGSGVGCLLPLREFSIGEEGRNRYGGGIGLTMFDVVIGKVFLVEHSAVGFLGGSRASGGGGSVGVGGRLLLLFLFLFSTFLLFGGGCCPFFAALGCCRFVYFVVAILVDVGVDIVFVRLWIVGIIGIVSLGGFG
mmetsp:Transcript_12058/g.14162  ORF Transcript_12058/g.14162 Transcript_12058/m.14162 type:complete len:338 (+) Transcript_12058:625-1638(+)